MLLAFCFCRIFFAQCGRTQTYWLVFLLVSLEKSERLSWKPRDSEEVGIIGEPYQSITFQVPEMQDGELVAVVGADAERRHVAHLHRQHRLELLGRVHLQDPGKQRAGNQTGNHATWGKLFCGPLRLHLHSPTHQFVRGFECYADETLRKLWTPCNMLNVMLQEILTKLRGLSVYESRKTLLFKPSLPVIFRKDDGPGVGLAVPVVLDGDGAEDDLVSAAAHVVLL